jgi:hypothetical protein
MRRWSNRRVILRTVVLGAVVAGAIVAAVTFGGSSPSQAVAPGFAPMFAGRSASGAGVAVNAGPDRATAITRIVLNPTAADTSPALGPTCPGGFQSQQTNLPELMYGHR